VTHRRIDASLPGLTRLRGRSRFDEAKARQSIARKSLAKKMDARVKPAHDVAVERGR
jgi:hypothetical protein